MPNKYIYIHFEGRRVFLLTIYEGPDLDQLLPRVAHAGSVDEWGQHLTAGWISGNKALGNAAYFRFFIPSPGMV